MTSLLVGPPCTVHWSCAVWGSSRTWPTHAWPPGRRTTSTPAYGGRGPGEGDAVVTGRERTNHGTTQPATPISTTTSPASALSLAVEPVRIDEEALEVEQHEPGEDQRCERGTQPRWHRRNEPGHRQPQQGDQRREVAAGQHRIAANLQVPVGGDVQ